MLRNSVNFSLLAPAATSHIQKPEGCDDLTESASDGQDRTSGSVSSKFD